MMNMCQLSCNSQYTICAQDTENKVKCRDLIKWSQCLETHPFGFPDLDESPSCDMEVFQSPAYPLSATSRQKTVLKQIRSLKLTWQKRTEIKVK